METREAVRRATQLLGVGWRTADGELGHVKPREGRWYGDLHVSLKLYWPQRSRVGGKTRERCRFSHDHVAKPGSKKFKEAQAKLTEVIAEFGLPVKAEVSEFDYLVF